MGNEANLRAGLYLAAYRVCGSVGGLASRIGMPVSTLKWMAYRWNYNNKMTRLADGRVLTGRAAIRGYVEEELQKLGATPEEIACLWLPIQEAAERLGIEVEETSANYSPRRDKTTLQEILEGGKMLRIKARRYWGFDRDPFQPQEFDAMTDMWEAPHIMEMVSMMTEMAVSGGFFAVYGEVGSGKTTALRRAEYLLSQARGIQVITPHCRNQEKMTSNMIADTLLNEISSCGWNDNQQYPPQGEEKFFRLAGAMRQMSRDGKQIVIMIDEAHLLQRAAVKFLKRLWEMQVQDGSRYRQLVSIILIGQMELRKLLRDARVSEVKIRTELEELTVMPGLQANDYLQFKLSRAGGNWNKFADAGLQAEIAFGLAADDYTPQRLNNLASNLLDYGYEMGEQVLTVELYDAMREHRGASEVEMRMVQDKRRQRGDENQVTTKIKAG